MARQTRRARKVRRLKDISPRSPEVRRTEAIPEPTGRWARGRAVLVRAATGVISDGSIHAGNLAYLSLLTLFPFVIVTAALARLLGQNQDTERTVTTLLNALPRPVALILSHPIADVLHHRTGLLLWLGGLVGLWTVGSYIETIRDILRRAYGTTSDRPFWQHRLRSVLLSVGAIIMMMMGFAGQVILAAVEQFVAQLLPMATSVSSWLRLSRLLPATLIFVALYLLFWSLAPKEYRTSRAPKWPGALFVMIWWFSIVQILPVMLSLLDGNTLTYGSLAGVIITLLFFWLIGYGLVIGANLNAALADPLKIGLQGAHSD